MGVADEGAGSNFDRRGSVLCVRERQRGQSARRIEGAGRVVCVYLAASRSICVALVWISCLEHIATQLKKKKTAQSCTRTALLQTARESPNVQSERGAAKLAHIKANFLKTLRQKTA